MPRSYSVFLVAILAGGGWFFTGGPGAGKFGDYVAKLKQLQNSAGLPSQQAPVNQPLPGYYTASPPAQSSSVRRNTRTTARRRRPPPRQ